MDSQTITLRTVKPADVLRVRAVAALDSSREPGQDALLGEIDGEVVAVITMRDGVVVADPFRHTSDVVALLRERREQLVRSGVLQRASQSRRRMAFRRGASQASKGDPACGIAGAPA